MVRAGRMLVGVMLLVLAAGCRAAMQVKEVPRTDLELEGAGNRGYLAGSPPAPGELKTTRQMVDLNIEVPSSFPGEPRQGMAPGDIPPPEIELEQAEMPESWTAPTEYSTYVVQEGDSLWSIAGKPDIYGKATQWRRIFDANRDLLKAPSDLKAKMTLKIPRGGDGPVEETRAVK